LLPIKEATIEEINNKSVYKNIRNIDVLNFSSKDFICNVTFVYIYKYAIVVVGKLYIHIGNHWINIGRSKFYVRCFGLKKKNQILHVL
jgi:hypothetical protein